MDIQKENSIFDNLNKKNLNEFLNIDLHSEIIAKNMFEKILSLTMTEININEIDKQTAGFCCNLLFSTCNQMLRTEYICHEFDDIKNKDVETLKHDISELSFLNEVLEENSGKYNKNNKVNNLIESNLSPNIRRKNTCDDNDESSSSINLLLNENIEYDCVRNKKNKWDILKCPAPCKSDFYSGSRMKFVQAKIHPVIHTVTDGKDKTDIKSKFNKHGRRIDSKSTVSLLKDKTLIKNPDAKDYKNFIDNVKQDNISGGGNTINNGSNDFNNIGNNVNTGNISNNINLNNNSITSNPMNNNKKNTSDKNKDDKENNNQDSPTITNRNKGNKAANYKYIKFEILEVQENKENPEIIKLRDAIKEKDNKLLEEEKALKDKSNRGFAYQKNERNENKEKSKEIDGKKMTFDSNGAVILIKSIPVERLPNDFVNPKIEVNELKDEKAASEILSLAYTDVKLLYQINEYVKTKNISSLALFLIKCKFEIGIEESSYENISKIIINSNPNGLPNTENLKLSNMNTTNLTNIKKKQIDQQVVVLGKNNIPEKKEKKADKVIQPAGSNFE